MNDAIVIVSEQEMHAVGRKIGGAVEIGDAIVLSGELGAGKTVLAKGILKGLGWDGEVASPSFALVHHYDPPDVRIPAMHVDLYRLDDPAELAELGLDEGRRYGVLIVEWPERARVVVLGDALEIRIERDGPGARRLTVARARAWERRWPIQ